MDQSVQLKTPTPLVRLLLLLSATTGMVDAASILGMGKVFTANMTGNVVFLGFAAAGAPDFHPLPYLTALGSFMFGALIAGWLWRARGERQLNRWLVLAALIESALLFAAGLLAICIASTPASSQARVLAIIAMTASAMGFRNAFVRKLKVPDLSTTVLTLTITGIASDAGPDANRRVRLGAVSMIFLGAVVGTAVFLRVGLGPTLILSGVVVLIGTIVFVRHPQMVELQR